jgi:putative peptidoglycan lipid II flippase
LAKTFAGATLLLMLMNALSRLLGFVRETAMAAVVGAGQYTDAYQVAYTLPYFLQMVLGVALVSSIVPAVVRCVEAGRSEEGWRVASVIMNLTVILMSAVALAGVFGAKYLVALTAPGFSPETAALASTMTAIMFPAIVLMSVALLITGVLNARRRFAAAAFAPAFSSLVIIIGVVCFGPGHPYALPVATLISFAGMLLVQLPALRAAGFRYSFSLDGGNPLVKNVFTNLAAVFLGTATYQIYLAINRFFASSLVEGSISALNYAGKLMNLPLGIFVAAVASGIFPLLSAQALAADRRQMWLTADRGLKLVLLITLPAAAGLMALGQPIVRLLFERAAFTSQATVMTAQALFWFGPGMGAMAATQILTRAYYAIGDTKTPLFFGLSSIAVDIAASAALTPLLRQGGLSLANSVASLYYALGLYIVLRRRLPGADWRGSALTLAKSLAGAVATAASALAIYGLLGSRLAAAGSLGLLLSVGAAIGGGIAVYFFVIFLLKENELFDFARELLARRGKSAPKN